MKRHAPHLRQALADSHALALRLDEPDFPLQEFEYLQGWQRKRLERSYDKLISQERYSAAGEFFLAELYGGLHFRERDQEMERVLPVMIRMLRDDMIRVLAEAFELQSLSLDFDMRMTAALIEAGWDELDTARYGEIYRATGRPAERARQIELIGRLGMELNELVHHRLVLWLIRTLRGPARAAGFGLLQSFLEQGLNAFQRMGDGTVFIETIWNSEREIMQRLFAGSEDPFTS
ncbi:MAG: hypothetical protein KJO80_03945 [Gammaproteobacteria bacterium]|nr:hypothetical protein [Gammaproteobacteria bacterium]